MKLKLLLNLHPQAITVQIIEQDSRFKATEETYFRFEAASNKFRIVSATGPELNRDTFYLRGSEVSKDNATVAIGFASDGERDVYVENLKAALLEWSIWAKEFRGDQKKTSVDDSSIFEV